MQGFFCDCCSLAPLEVSLCEPLEVLEREELVSLELLADGGVAELLDGDVVCAKAAVASTRESTPRGNVERFMG